MDKVLSVLIIEDDTEAVEELKSLMTDLEDIKFVAHTNNSTDGIRLTKMHLPNVVILDLELHHGGGSGLLYLKELGELSLEHPPFILVTTHNMSDVILEQARLLGADFTHTKFEEGYSNQYVIDTIRLLRPAILKKNSEISARAILTPAQLEEYCITRIRRELDLIGVKPSVLGYTYLTHAILNHVRGKRGHIKDELALQFGKTPESIERAMITAIRQAWLTTPTDDLEKYYTARYHVEKGCPTLMEFVCYYGDKLKVEIESGNLQTDLKWR